MALVDNVWYTTSVGWTAVTAWSALASKVCGNFVRQSATPTVGNERVFVCTASTAGTGATGASEPTWVVTRGGSVTDATVTWMEATGIAALNGDLTNTPNWNIVKNTAVSVGQVIQNVAGNLILICTTAGTAGNGAEPSWAAFTNAGATTADNTATWTTLGASFTAWGTPHARVENALASNWGQAGNKFFVKSNHAQTDSTNGQITTWTSPSGNYLWSYIICVDGTHAPPQSGDVTTGASLALTGTSLTFQFQDASRRFLFINGIAFSIGNGASSNANIYFVPGTGDSGSIVYLKNCSLKLNTSNVGATIALPRQAGASNFGNVIIWENTTLTFGGTAQSLVSGSGTNNAACNFRWKNTASALGGATFPTTLFTAAPTLVHITGVDLSALGSGATIFGAVSRTDNTTLAVVEDCKLGATVTLAATPTGNPANRYSFVRCDSGATSYRTEVYDFFGQQVTETVIVRTGGASDGTTQISWKFGTTAYAAWVAPFVSIPIAEWNGTTGANVTVTIEGIQDPRISTSLPNNDDIWIDFEYLGSGSNPQGSFGSGTKANLLASGSALTASTQPWDSLVTARANSHAYSVGDQYKSANNSGRVFFCTTAGTSAGSEPGGIATAVDGGAVTDGTAVFTAAVRFKQAITLSSPTPGLIGDLRGIVRVAKASASGYYIDPLMVLS